MTFICLFVSFSPKFRFYSYMLLFDISTKCPNGIYHLMSKVNCSLPIVNYSLHLPQSFFCLLMGILPSRCLGPHSLIYTTYSPAGSPAHNTHTSVSSASCQFYLYYSFRIRQILTTSLFHSLIEARILFYLDYCTIYQTNPLSSILKRVNNLKVSQIMSVLNSVSSNGFLCHSK